uniref:C2H2-type domain-containing protein n=1 Tax=Malurus cyaneus samueli TaxID=2593467 RepID=A0A8C5U3I1_9PASS
MGDDRPFVCSAPGCGQRFTNEDHLAVHKHKHEMTLKFGPARSRLHQTPTPTRFLKNCEEVGLFNELASSFEHEFKKAAEDDEKKARGRDLGLLLFKPKLISLIGMRGPFLLCPLFCGSGSGRRDFRAWRPPGSAPEYS